MKYIIGAGIGGLFGISVPFMIDVHEAQDNEVPREEDSQLVEEKLPSPIDGALILPDNYCGYIDYETKEAKEQAKECLNNPMLAIPAI